MAYCRDVFDNLSDIGNWDIILIADGSIGIGGDPARLLRRCRELARYRGSIVVEVEPPGGRDGCGHLRVSAEGLTGWLPWAWVSADSIVAWAQRSGLKVRQTIVTDSGRYAVELVSQSEADGGMA